MTIKKLRNGNYAEQAGIDYQNGHACRNLKRLLFEQLAREEDNHYSAFLTCESC